MSLNQIRLILLTKWTFRKCDSNRNLGDYLHSYGDSMCTQAKILINMSVIGTIDEFDDASFKKLELLLEAFEQRACFLTKYSKAGLLKTNSPRLMLLCYIKHKKAQKIIEEINLLLAIFVDGLAEKEDEDLEELEVYT